MIVREVLLENVAVIFKSSTVGTIYFSDVVPFSVHVPKKLLRSLMFSHIGTLSIRVLVLQMITMFLISALPFSRYSCLC